MPASTPHVIALSGIRKDYPRGAETVSVLKEIDLALSAGGYLAVMGPSGSGKSTLLNILGCLDRPTSGGYLLDGMDVFQFSDDELSRLRATHIGFVFQTFNLIPTLNVFENIELPFLYGPSWSPQEQKERIMEVMQRVGLEKRMLHRPSQLSGGEMQRVAIARAMVIRPKIILADEPTGNLDSKTGAEILALFRQFHDAGGTIVMITHDPDVAAHAGVRIVLKDGRIIDQLS